MGAVGVMVIFPALADIEKNNDTINETNFNFFM